MWAAEQPFFRRERTRVGDRVPPTSFMLDAIRNYLQRFKELPLEKRRWVQTEFSKEALALFLFQVNRIEGEGFDTLQETRDAIAGGILAGNRQSLKKSEAAAEAVQCLHDAYRLEMDAAAGQQAFQLSVARILEAHRVLMESTRPEIAGVLRKEDEVAFTNTTVGLPHVFVWPTEVETALHDLVHATNLELAEIVREGGGDSQVERIMELAISFYAKFESVHPFRDGNGRIGRILLATMLQSTGVLPFPNVLFVEAMRADPPLVDTDDFKECFEKAQVEQQFEECVEEGGRRAFKITKEAAVCEVLPPVELAALVVEGIYVGWKRLFEAMSIAFGERKQVEVWQPKWRRAASAAVIDVRSMEAIPATAEKFCPFGTRA